MAIGATVDGQGVRDKTQSQYNNRSLATYFHKNEVPHIVIDPAGDLIVRLYTAGSYGETFVDATQSMTSGRITATFQVNCATLAASCSGPPPESITSGYVLDGKNLMDVNKGTMVSLELWFRVLHGSLTSEMYAIPINEIWEAIHVSDEWCIDIGKLQEWFASCWQRQDKTNIAVSDVRQLLFPCWKLNHIGAFNLLTCRLAYEAADHITEINPTAHRHLHLPKNIMNAITSAKGNVRTKLLQGLFDPVGQFLKQNCSCKETTLFAYCIGLSKTGLWPLESHHRLSTRAILDSEGFQKFDCVIPEKACVNCAIKLRRSTVDTIRNKIQYQFGGLCLDCMEMSKTGDLHSDYWLHDSSRKWDANCRIAHDQTTWYFSFMGRREDMIEWQKLKKERKQDLKLKRHMVSDLDLADE